MLLFPAPSVATLALVTEGNMVGFCKAWRAEAALTVGDLVVKPCLRTCVRYFRALRDGMPALPLVLSRDSEGPNYSYQFADGRTDPLLTYFAAQAAGLE